uniref:DUF4423 domain-containing protein n=1 Tax=uncultured microorganism TaxID=358574 RepID=F8UGX4_9ZZZZ|nr:hypothetical protein LDC_03685 [uncultured microorganism]
MPNLFEYTDYRKYLTDYYNEKKAKNHSFSYNCLSMKAGLKSKGTLHEAIHGKRNLSKQSVIKLSQAIGHNRKECEYFENLVFFNQEKGLKERSYFHERMEEIKPQDKATKDVLQLRKDQYEFYSKWYHSAIRSLIDMYPFKDDYAWLAKNVYPSITTKQAKKSIELLDRLGLIEKQKNGSYKLTSQSISSGEDITSLAALNFHKEAAQLAQNALDQLPSGKRNISGLTLGLSEKTYNKICDEIQSFRSKVVKMVEADHEADRTYHLNFHFFPVTNTDIKNKE